MSEEKNSNDTSEISDEEYKKLIEKHTIKAPRENELIKGHVISASKSEVKLDIDGVITGVVRGPELYEEDDDYAGLKPGDEVEATVIDTENENGELELSFRFAGQEKAWAGLTDAFKNKTIINVKVADANKGGLLVKYRQIPGFLPVSQLAPENYPRINGGDKGKILEKLRSFVGQEFETKVMTLDQRDDKIIFSEKEAWNEKQKDIIAKYQVGTVVEGKVTAITNFGVFISFGENLEGLIHISELAWQRIDDPNDLCKVGDDIKAEVISLENSKIFLSAKKLIKDPWHNVDKKYKAGQIVEGKVLKVNPFGLFVSLDDDIHGLAHISQLELRPKERIDEKYKSGVKMKFKIVSIEPKDHRLGLMHSDEIDKQSLEKIKSEKDKKEEKPKEDKKKATKKEEKEEKPKEDKKKATKKKATKKEEKEGKPKKKEEAKKTDKKKKELPARAGKTSDKKKK
jgi:ribosomal protein S1